MKKISKRLLSLIAALCMLAALVSAPALAAEENAVSNVRNSVAVVNTGFDADGQWFSFGHGTGFFVGTPGEEPQYLITNHHVIDAFTEYGSGELVNLETDDISLTGRAKIRVYYDSSTYDEAYLVDSNEIKDIALLKLDQPTEERIPLHRDPRRFGSGQAPFRFA